MESALRHSALAIALFSTPVFAGFINVWQLLELAEAPVLAVCRVERVMPGADLPPGKLRWHTPTRNMRAVLTVVRSLPVMEQTSITINYYGYGSASRGVTQGDAMWPALSAGDIRVFPLVQVAGQWRLAMEEGRNNLIPAIAPPRPEAPSTVRYDFLIGELVNSLSWGGYRDICDVALYLRDARGTTVSESLMPLLRQNIDKNWERWADIASCSLANLGIPRSSLAEIRAIDPPRMLPTLALRQLSPRDYPELIVRRMIGHSDIHDWGSAATLQEYAKDPLLLKLLADRLRAPAPGAMHIAGLVVYSDPQSPIIPVALEAAFRALDNSKSTRNDLYAAPKLIIGKGSETQFTALKEKFRAAQRTDLKLYAAIFNAVFGLDLPRARQISAAMLEDRRLYTGPLRYCDVAVANLQSITKEKFGFTVWNQPLAERDKAVENASRWLKTHPQ